MNSLKNYKKYIFYDAECLMCSSFIDFANNAKHFTCIHNKQLEVKSGDQTLFLEKIIDSSIIVIDENKILLKSEAIIYIMSHIKFLKIISIILCIFPKWILDLFYDFIAKHRLLIFKKKNTCKL